jgi:N-acetylglucosamine kinase-like BadF-type ATPase
MPLAIGIDGGNTKTVALVCTLDGEVVGLARGGSSNWEGSSYEQAAACITEVVDRALASAGGARADIAWMHGGLAGIDWPQDETRIAEALRAVGWTCGLSLENDAFSGIRASSPNGHGLGANAGTGIACGILHPDGGTYFYGAFTDLGGGREIDLWTVQAVIRAEDGRGPATALTAALLEATGCATVLELVYAIHRGERRYPSHHVVRPALFRTAAQGDPVAVGIVSRFAEELALCVSTLVRRYHLEQEPVAVVAAGSLFQKTGPLLFTRFRDAVLAEAPQAQLILADHPPLMGALRGALRACGRDEPALYRTLCESAQSGNWFSDDALDTSSSEP